MPLITGCCCISNIVVICVNSDMICSNAALLDFLKIENVAFSGDAFFLSAL